MQDQQKKTKRPRNEFELWAFGEGCTDDTTYGEKVERWNKLHPEIATFPTEWKKGEFDFAQTFYDINKRRESGEFEEVISKACHNCIKENIMSSDATIGTWPTEIDSICATKDPKHRDKF